VKDTARKRALLLYQAGPEVHEIFKTLPDTGDEKNYEAAVNALTAYFEPEKNRIYQTYMFRQVWWPRTANSFFVFFIRKFFRNKYFLKPF
jgi:hypothetical protein